MAQIDADEERPGGLFNTDNTDEHGWEGTQRTSAKKNKKLKGCSTKIMKLKT